MATFDVETLIRLAHLKADKKRFSIQRPVISTPKISKNYRSLHIVKHSLKNSLWDKIIARLWGLSKRLFKSHIEQHGKANKSRKVIVLKWSK